MSRYESVLSIPVLCKLELTQPSFTDRVSLGRKVGFTENVLNLIRKILLLKLGGM